MISNTHFSKSFNIIKQIKQMPFVTLDILNGCCDCIVSLLLYPVFMSVYTLHISVYTYRVVCLVISKTVKPRVKKELNHYIEKN